MSSQTLTDTLGDVLRLIELTLKVPADKVDIDANFETFGINSLIVMELMENIERELDVTLTPAQFSNVDNVRGLAELLDRLKQPQAPAHTAAAAAQPIPVPKAIGLTPASARNEVDRLLEEITQQYAISLYGRGLDSVDSIVDVLINEHSDSLLLHYGLAAEIDTPRTNRPGARPVAAPAIAIVGISCRMPDAEDHHQFWDNLISGRNSIREIPASRWRWQDHYAESVQPGKTISKWGALIEDVDCFDAEFFGITDSDAASTDPQLRLLLEETYRAVEDAGIDMRSLAGSRTGVFVGYEYSEYEHHLRRLNNQDFTQGPLFSSSSPAYYLSNRISYVFDLCGPSESINVNCASSAVALNRAFQSLQNGESNLAIAAAASLNLFAGDYIASSQYGVLSPDGSSGVFDDEANGFTRGEAVAGVVLKRLADAERDGDRIYAVIRSSHQTYRGAARNISEVKHEAISRVLSECYAKADIDANSIRYIEVDGYASKWADSFEYEGIKGAFATLPSSGKRCALGSLKGNIGNVESVSGMASLIKLALSLHHGRFPATISMKKRNSFIDIDNPNHPLYIADRELNLVDLRDMPDQPVRAGLNSFADSGSNLHIVLEEYRAPARSTAGVVARQLFLLSARTPTQLAACVQRHISFLEHERVQEDYLDLALTTQVGREAHAERLAIVAGSNQELLEKLRLVAKAGIRERLGLEGREIFHARIESSTRLGVASLISEDMALTQLQQCQHSGDWKQIGLLWVNGVAIPWHRLWQGQAVRKASLPTYPFARTRHWIDVEPADPAAPSEARSVTTATLPIEQASDAAAQGDPAPKTPRWFFYFPREVDGAEDAFLPAEKLELFMQQEVAAQQKIELGAVDCGCNFLDLGMNSIGVAELIIKLDALLQINLSPSVLFKHPEIRSLSAYLADAYGERVQALRVASEPPASDTIGSAGVAVVAEKPGAPRPADFLIPLQPQGERAALFALPGAGGGAVSLQRLSQVLGREQPFFCLEAVDVEGEWPPMPSVEANAAFARQAIREHQAQGPYRLLGYSNGGLVAFEIARQLLEEGDEASLVLLDTLAPGHTGKDPLQEMVEVFRHFIGSLGASTDLSLAELQAVPAEDRAAFLYTRTEQLGLNLPRRQFLNTFAAAQSSEIACQSYQPLPLTQDLDLILFRSDAAYPEAPRDYGWSALLTQAPRVVELQGDHFGVLESPAAEEIARHLDTPVEPTPSPAAPRQGRKRGRG
ncbi:beta-ketoacyl synthase N-terminal-like domain-containing protein [Aquimonas sp.]|uniref:beta-ketoacyl synthase N-terminal-like domain-containing protein n=1 Tax=Aquimonas sp. TaxID=1872588 RepID=UPI0037C10B24